MMVMSATKDLWARTTSITAVINDVNGLFSAVDLLLNPSNLSAYRIQAMFRHFLDIYSQTNWKAGPDRIADVIITLIHQHVETVR